MKHGKNFLILMIIGTLIGAYMVKTEEELTHEEKQAQCKYLNNVRTNFTFCCQFPTIVIWNWQFSMCANECIKKNAEWNCCINTCCFQSLGVLKKSEDRSGRFRVDHTGLVYSFLLSVGNDSQWLPVLESSTKTCFDQLDGSGEGYTCGVVPLELFSIIDCSYLENYIRCPSWNSAPACHNTMNYVKKCMRGDV